MHRLTNHRMLVTWIVQSLAVSIVLGLIGLFSVWAHEAWLLPSLASAAFLQTLTPNEPSARPWNTAVGQLAGAVGGFAGVFLTSAWATPTFMGDHPLAMARVAAAVIGVFVAALLQHLLKATSAAGGATALIVAVGAETATAAGVLRLVCGVLLVTTLGEAARRIILAVR